MSRLFTLKYKITIAVSLLLVLLISTITYATYYYFKTQLKATIAQNQFVMVTALADEYPDAKRILTPTQPTLLLSRVLAGFEGTGETVNSYGVRMLTSYKHLKTNNWILAANYPDSKAHETLIDAQKKILVAAIIGIICVVLIVFYLIKHLTDPIVLFTQHVETLHEKTGADRLLNIKSYDEIGTLSYTFNRMIVELDEQKGALKENARSLEEQAVELKASQEQIRETLEFTEGVINAIPDLLFEADGEGRYLNVWTRTPELLAAQKEVLLGKTVREVLSPESAAVMMDSLREAQEIGLSFGKVIHIDLPQGKSWFEISVSRMSGGSPSDVRFLVLSRDITERKRMEDTLHASEEKLRAIFESANDGIFLHRIVERDGNTRFILHDLNRKGCELWGHSREDILSGNFDLLAMSKQPYTFEEATRRNLLAAAGEPQLFDWQLKRGDGSKVWGEVNLRRIRIGDEDFLLAVMRDLTERKHMEKALTAREQKFRSLAKNLPVAVIRYDTGCRRRYVNPAAERMLHGNSSELLGNVPGGPTVPATPAMIEHYRGKMEEVLATGEACELDFVLDTMPAGQQEQYEVRFVSEHGADGQPIGVLAIWFDVTGMKRVEEDLQRKNNELERFTYTVSHDLKSPIVTIKTFSGAIMHDLNNGRHDRLVKDLDRISAAADKMALLLDDLLKLSRVGRIINPPEPVAMTQLLDSVLKTLDGILRESCVQVILQPGLPTVMCDCQRIAEVLQNLIENAIKYRGNQSELRIVIGLRKDGDQAVFFVQDNGPGIDPKYHENIFGLFNRLETKIPGTGIGLALVKRIIETHGGKVWVESDGQGNGSTFCFTVL